MDTGLLPLIVAFIIAILFIAVRVLPAAQHGQHRPAGAVGVVEAARRVPRDPRARARRSSRRSSTSSSAVDMREIPAPRRPPGGHHQGQRRRHGQRHDLHPGRRRQAGAVQRRQLRRRHRRPGPHGAALGHRHADARRGAVRARADQHRRPAADGGRHRQVGHPHQPDRDRRDHPAAADPPGAGPAEAGRPGEAGQDPPVRGPSSSRPSTSPTATRQAAIRAAEGERQAAILRAEGNRQAAILEAEGRAQAIETVYGAITAAEPEPDAGRDPPARHAEQVRRQPQHQDRRPGRIVGAAGRRPGDPVRARPRCPPRSDRQVGRRSGAARPAAPRGRSER